MPSAIPATTPKALRAALIPLIQALVPDYEPFREYRWRHRKDQMIGGPEIRTFRIFHSIAVPCASPNTPEGPEPYHQDGGMWGGGTVEFAYEMVVRTAYGGIAETEDEDLVWHDGRQLAYLMIERPGSVADALPGMVGARWLSPAEGDGSGEGNLVIDHRYAVHFMAQDRS